MSFSPDSEELMKLILPDFDSFLVKKTPLQQKKLDNILKILYNDIKLAERWASAENTLSRIKTHLKDKEESKENLIPQSLLHESKYIPEFIRSYIIQHLKGYVIYKIKIGDRNVEFHFGILQEKDYHNLSQFDNYVKRMIIWLKMAFQYAPLKCSKTLKIYAYLTPFKKQLPGNQFTIISQNHCNSAVTTSCTPHGEIILYRAEEFIKVFIHETFHTLGLDFSNMPLTSFNKKVRQLFPINSEFNLFEAYTEFWASTMNSLISAYLLTENKDEQNFLIYSDFCCRFEQIFSLFQMVKILDFMGLNYQNLFSNDSVSNGVRRYLFKEKSNVFAYYVIKNLLLYFNVDFLIWCKRHNNNLLTFNKNSSSLNSFLQFIDEKHQNKTFLKDIEKMHEFLKKQKGHRAEPKHNKLTKTMRMTLCELSLN